MIDILNPNGTLNEKAQILVGEDRFVARKKIKKLLDESGHLVQLQDYVTSIGRSERTNSVVEPRLTLQWFLDMKEMARVARHSVEGGDIKFNPPHFWNMFYSWLREDNIRDWCISRQLLWGQRIPAWYLGEDIYVAETAEEALEQARAKTGNADLQLSDLKQDDDVVDTWFSSWLWPISVFDGFDNQDELRYYYPTNVLVTAWDIIFFWVARMIMSGYEWSGDLLGLDTVLAKGRMPFKDVYFTGMVRDNKRRKMSKSLGNSPDALTLIETYGADGIRFGVLSSSAAGNDIIFDAPLDPKTKQVLNESKLCEQGRNFCNKMWNALRLIKGWDRAAEISAERKAINDLAYRWLSNRFDQTLTKVDRLFSEYRLSEAVMDLYKFIWGDFCSWYLEMIKPPYGEPIDEDTYEKALDIFGRMMTLLHPFMPFITEEIWHNLKERTEGEDCVISAWPTASSFDENLLDQIEKAKQVVSSIREIRNSKGLKQKELLKVYRQNTGDAGNWATAGLTDMVIKMANLESLTDTDTDVENSVSFLVGRDKFFVELSQEIDTQAEYERLKKDLEYYQGFVQKVEKKLANERFVNNAPEKVVEMERKKLADGKAKLENLEEALSKLN